MHRALSSKWLRSALSMGDRAALAEVPVYLCPSLSNATTRHTFAPTRTYRKLPYRQRRCVHVETTPASEPLPSTPEAETPPSAESSESLELLARKLPLLCSGCGAPSQTVDSQQAGYFDLTRKVVREFVSKDKVVEKKPREDDIIVNKALQNLSEEQKQALGLDPRLFREGEELETDRPGKGPVAPKPLLCDRCHELVHHHTGVPIFHPTVDSLRETIEESPFRYNHIYHVIDAADFPMSFMPKLHMLLDANLKHRNRRNTGRWSKNRKFDMDFIVTRSDLLAPKKEMVDRMMPYLREVLRRSLGKYGKLVTLGNVRCVSAHRGWWTKELRSKIYERGGAGWMLGKVNVGKSQLVHAVFPKGTTTSLTTTSLTSKHPIEVSMFASEEDAQYVTDDVADFEPLDENSLLPPARDETNYPELPTVSALPGTTAAPIRLPYGNGKGELIDLPGVARSNLEDYVKPEHRQCLVMKHRITPDQHSIKPGQSLLLGSLIRITPTTPDLIFLAYNFTPIPEHLTATEKAVEFQAQTRPHRGVPQISMPGIGDKMKLAGTFQLRYDVTKERSGPLTRKDVGNMRVEDLPWRVLSIDILIEGVGWVEITAQVRTRHLFAGCEPSFIDDGTSKLDAEEEEKLDPFIKMEKAALQQAGIAAKRKEKKPEDPEPNWPVVEVYTPEGKFIDSRLPMNAWLINKHRKKDMKARPRKSMKGEKKMAKMAKRAAEAAASAAS